MVYEGLFQDRRVAVKRMLGDFYELARHEIELMMASDDSHHVVQYYAMEQDPSFVYLAFELCDRTLADLVLSKEFSPLAMTDPPNATLRPATLSLDLLSAVAQAIAYIHREGMVHRDVKPQVSSARAGWLCCCLLCLVLKRAGGVLKKGGWGVACLCFLKWAGGVLLSASLRCKFRSHRPV